MKPSELAKKVLAAFMRPRRLAALGVLARRQWRGTRGADDPWFPILDGIHRHNLEHVGVSRRAIADLLRHYPLPPATGERGTALVLLLRGQWPGHIAHHYLVAHALARLDYRAMLVVCDGFVERCGLTQLQLPHEVPPISCSACRDVLEPVKGSKEHVISLLDLRAVDEADRIAAADARDTLPAHTDRLMATAILRHFQGDESLARDEAEVATYRRAALRYACRFHAACDAERPSVAVFFNGQSFPESVLAAIARDRGITCLFTERGVAPNSTFICRDEPASHYRNPALWEATEPTITAEQCDAVRAFVESRKTRNIDPLGNDRGFDAGDDGRYRDLATRPFVVFFAPVIHDTAAMGKDGPFGGPLATLAELCRAAERTGVMLVVRAHPDERKPPNPARFTIRDFLKRERLDASPYVRLLDSHEVWNPYRLAADARAVVVYNGTIGMECPVLGIPVANLGASHYACRGFTAQPADRAALDAVFAAGLPRLTTGERDRAARYLHFYLHVATLPTDALFRELSNNLTEAPVPSPLAGEQLANLTERVRFLLGCPAPVGPAAALAADA